MMLSEISLNRGKSLSIAIVTTITVFLLLSISASALSGSGGGTWQYYRDITINNTGGAALSDYQILVNLTGAAFPARANTSGADIRFEQGGAELSYWFENWDYANASALVWVNVTALPVGESVVRMWYGNPLAGSSNSVTATFMRVIDGGQPVAGSWNLDEGSGTIAHDTSGNANDGDLFYGPTWVDGKHGKALTFNGVNDYVFDPSTPNIDGGFQVSYEAWVYPTSKPADGHYGGIVVAGNGYDGGWINMQCRLLYLATMNFDMNCGTNNSNTMVYWYTSNVYSINSWYHVVAVFNNGFTDIYVNGNLNNGIGTTSPGAFVNTATPNIVSIGTHVKPDGSSAGEYFNGTIDEVRIYNRALNADEVLDLYNNYGYTTTNYPGRVLVRKYTSPEPTITSLGAEKTPTVRIANGMLYVNQNANGSLNVTYGNFSSGDSSDIIIYKDTNGNGTLDIPGDTEVYNQTDALTGSDDQVIKVNWIPDSTGLNWVVANGVHSSIVVTDIKPVSPVPELVTVALVGIGLIGLMLAFRKKN